MQISIEEPEEDWKNQSGIRGCRFSHSRKESTRLGTPSPCSFPFTHLSQSVALKVACPMEAASVKAAIAARRTIKSPSGMVFPGSWGHSSVDPSTNVDEPRTELRLNFVQASSFGIVSLVKANDREESSLAAQPNRSTIGRPTDTRCNATYEHAARDLVSRQTTFAAFRWRFAACLLVCSYTHHRRRLREWNEANGPTTTIITTGSRERQNRTTRSGFDSVYKPSARWTELAIGYMSLPVDNDSLLIGLTPEHSPGLIGCRLSVVYLPAMTATTMSERGERHFAEIATIFFVFRNRRELAKRARAWDGFVMEMVITLELGRLTHASAMIRRWAMAVLGGFWGSLYGLGATSCWLIRVCKCR